MNEQEDEQLAQEILNNPSNWDIYLIAFSERVDNVLYGNCDIGERCPSRDKILSPGNFKLAVNLLKRVRIKREFRHYEERLARQIDAFGSKPIILDNGDTYLNYRVWYKVPKPIEYDIGDEVFKGLIHCEDEEYKWCIFENPSRLQEFIEREKKGWGVADPPIEPLIRQDLLMNRKLYYSIKKLREDLWKLDYGEDLDYDEE